MNWIQLNDKHYINADQMRDILFVVKDSETIICRLFFTNGQSHDIKGFITLEDAKLYATKTFGLPEDVVEKAVKTKVSK